MSKYKVGDKFVVEITDIRPGTYIVNGTDLPYKMVKENGSTTYHYSESDLDKLEKLDMTAEETWEIAKKLFVGCTREELNEIFGPGWTWTKIKELSLREAKEKIEAWEKAKEEFQVGDVVRYIDDPDIKVLITRRYGDGTHNGIDASGSIFSGISKKHWTKTGRHCDIESILKRLKEES